MSSASQDRRGDRGNPYSANLLRSSIVNRTEPVRPEDGNAAPIHLEHTFALQPVEGNRHPLASGPDHVGKILLTEGGVDDQSVFFNFSIELAQAA